MAKYQILKNKILHNCKIYNCGTTLLKNMQDVEDAAPYDKWHYSICIVMCRGELCSPVQKYCITLISRTRNARPYTSNQYLLNNPSAEGWQALAYRGGSFLTFIIINVGRDALARRRKSPVLD